MQTALMYVEYYHQLSNVTRAVLYLNLQRNSLWGFGVGGVTVLGTRTVTPWNRNPKMCALGGACPAVGAPYAQVAAPLAVVLAGRPEGACGMRRT
jgi:hypothetical protein